MLNWTEVCQCVCICLYLFVSVCITANIHTHIANVDSVFYFSSSTRSAQLSSLHKSHALSFISFSVSFSCSRISKHFLLFFYVSLCLNVRGSGRSEEWKSFSGWNVLGEEGKSSVQMLDIDSTLEYIWGAFDLLKKSCTSF